MFKKVIAILMLLILIRAVPVAAADEVNVLVNEGFEEVGAGQPSSWTIDAWNNGAEYSRMVIQQEQVHSGQHAAMIENLQPNDAKYVQKVTVSPNTLYRLSAYLLVESADTETKGANISVLGVTETSQDFKSTEGWQLVEMYGKTGKNQKELQVAVRLGGYGSLTKGKAYFDDVSLVKVASVPAGASTVDWVTREAAELPDAVSSLGIAGFALLFGLMYAFIYQRWLRGSHPAIRATDAPRNFLTPFIVLAVFAFALRVFIAMRSPGYVTDVSTFKAWAHNAASGGLRHFYDGQQFADYPPAYIYVLWFLGKLQAAFQIAWESKGALLLIKLPALLADIALGWLIFREGAKRIGGAAGFGLAALYLLNPAVLVNSAGWGQIDALFTLVLVLALLFLVQNRWAWSGALFALAILIKPQALIFTPVFLYPVIRQKNWRGLIRAFAAMLGVFVVIVFPFSLEKNGIGWVFELYGGTLSQYAYATLNAFNLYALFGLNWVAADSGAGILNYQTIGYVFIVLAVILSANYYFRKRKDGGAKLFYIAFLLLFMVFMFSAKMHERYLFPALVLLLFAFLFSREKRLIHLFTALSVAHYFNVHYVLKSSAIGQPHIAHFDGVMLAFSGVHLLLFLWAVKIGYDLWMQGREEPVPPHPVYTALPEDTRSSGLLHDPGSNAKMDRFTRKDWLWMGLLTLVYAAVALYNLGSLKSPETTWQPAYNSYAIADFGEVRQIAQVNTLGEIGNGKFKLEFAETEGQWGNEVIVENTYTKVFWWNVQPLTVSARYVKISVDSAGFALNEMAFYEAGSTKPLIIASVTDNADTNPPQRGEAAYLFDEQDEAVHTPSYLNQTYFDEIYHARTAYEHLHLMKHYETTHPPLGKLIISVGIWLFGMNPFGWRIMGTLVGILMIPLTYVFARRLFGRTEYAFLAAFLMSVDFMHFAQTRIATIDSYGVFFIMLMYYYMYRYYSMNFYRDPLRKTLKPLFLSGLFFGIGAASKWIVVYGGAGLALIFFLSLYERFRQYREAQSFLRLPETYANPELNAELKSIRRRFKPLAIKTVAWCTLFFVIIPILIYSLSFVPQMAVPGEEKSLSHLVQYQEDMYNYHSKLKATHGFGSPWYEWPLMVRPIWFYSGKTAVAADQVSSIWSFGNPAIWWVGLIAFIAALVLYKKTKHRGMFVVGVAFFSQFLPWVLVTRLTFIYHYFAMVPFLIFAIVYMCKRLTERNPAFKKGVIAYAAVSLLLFLMFYPVLSGMTVPKSYVDTFLQWFGTWYFYTG